MPSSKPQQPSPDELIAAEMGRFEFDPLGYVKFTWDWGHGDLADQDGPDEWQANLLREVGEALRTSETAVRFAVTSGHGVGKTALSAWIIHWFMATRPGCAGVVTANTRDQLVNKTWRELNKWNGRAINGHWFDWSATAIRGIEKPGSWFIAAQPWSKERSEAFAGLHEGDVLALFDEASAIDDIIWDVTEGAMTQRGALWLTFGNPTRNTGRFRECFGRNKHRWRTFKVDSRSAKMTNKAQIQQWINDYGEDSDFVRVRIKGEFPRTGSMQLIPSDRVSEALTRPVFSLVTDPLVMGVDVARYGDDESVIAFRKGRDARSIPWITMRETDLMTLAGRVAEEAKYHGVRNVFVDESGLGAGVIDRLRQLGIKAIGVNFGGKPVGLKIADERFRARSRDGEMWSAMREWLEHGALPNDPELEAQLTAREYSYSPDGAIVLERKDDMKKRGLSSPDRADALALTFAAAVTPAGINRPTHYSGQDVILG